MAGLPWGEVSKWVALLTLTLVGVMEYRGMLRRPVGLLPTPLQRASSMPLGQPGPQFAAGASSAPVIVVSAMEPSSVAAGIRGGISSDAVGVVAPSGHAQSWRQRLSSRLSQVLGGRAFLRLPVARRGAVSA